MTDRRSDFSAQGQVLVAGEAAGVALVLSEPLSLWGGLDPVTGKIIDQRHPALGAIVSGRVLVLPAGRGSSSASSILLEAVRLETAPVAIITAEVDPILALGAAVAIELYGRAPAVLVLPSPAYAQLESGWQLAISRAGAVRGGRVDA
jgi:uncharacterized protein